MKGDFQSNGLVTPRKENALGWGLLLCATKMGAVSGRRGDREAPPALPVVLILSWVACSQGTIGHCTAVHPWQSAAVHWSISSGNASASREGHTVF